jgi:TRAP transporter TAXI family solute receptor
MKFLTLLALCFALLLTSLSTSSSAEEAKHLSLMSGSESGTYYQIGKDLQKLMYPDIDLEVLPSQGSLINLMFLSGDTDYELAIVQNDVLHSDAAAKLGADKLRVLLPLYQEEVHLLAKKDIQNIKDLNDRRVSVGISGSGTHFSATAILEAFNITPQEKVYMRAFKALDALQHDEVDAMFYVIGYPAPIFEHGVEATSNLHLVDIPALPDSPFEAGEIPANIYTWQKTAVSTLAVRAILITRAYTPNDVRCNQVGRFARKVVSNLPALQEKGHEKWRHVEFDLAKYADLPSVSPCALGMLRQE